MFEAKMSSQPTFYKAELDGLRFFAFTGVFLCHAMPFIGPWTNAVINVGANGVTLFFVLSSYLITTLMVREKEQTGKINVKAFYVRRALRIWPLYYVAVIAGCAIASLPFHYGAAFSLFLGNWAVVIWGFPYILHPLWSVGVEEQFYLAWPPLLKLVGGKEGITKLAFWMLITSMTVRCELALLHASSAQVVTNTLAQLDPIAAGAMLAVKLENRTIKLKVVGRLALLVLGIGLLVLCRKNASFGHELWRSLFTAVVLYPVSTIAVTLIFVAAIDSTGFLRWRGIVYLGRISYGLYVIHAFALHFTGMDTVGHRLEAYGLTVVTATVSYQCFERKFLRFKNRFR